MHKPRYTLSRKLGLGIILTATPIFILSLGVFFFFSHNLIHEEASERTASTLNTNMQRVINYMNAVKTAATSNAWLLEANFTPDSLESISRRIVTRNRSIFSCSVGTEPNTFPQYGRKFSVFSVNNGDTILTGREPDYEYFNKMWYKTTRSIDKPCWINPFSDHVEAPFDHDDAVASFCVPLHAPDGHVVGIVATDFSFSTLTRIITSSKLPYPDAYYMLLGGDGRYLVHPNANFVFKKTIFTGTNTSEHSDLITLGHQMTAGKTGSMHVTIGGHRCHVSFSSIPDTDWSLALVVPAAQLMRPYRYLVYSVLTLILFGLLIILWLSQRAVRQTIAPIYELQAMTREIANGHYDQTIPLSHRNDAVSRLQNSFVAMQQAIKRQVESVEHTVQEISKYNVEQRDEMQQAEASIERKDQFISHVLYQIKRPISVIQECAVELRESPAIPKPQLANIAYKMRYNSTNLIRMLLMLFDSSDARTNDSSMYEKGDTVYCNKLAHDCIEFVEKQFLDVKIHFETEVSDDTHLQSNYLYLMRTVREILYNAAKHTGGEHILFRIAQTPDKMQFIIEDRGPGLPDNPHDLLFMPFMKSDSQSEGFGLGLPLSKRHAVALGGDLIYDATYKEGCRFIVEMPR